jgi:hypothetical protein
MQVYAHIAPHIGTPPSATPESVAPPSAPASIPPLSLPLSTPASIGGIVRKEQQTPFAQSAVRVHRLTTPHGGGGGGGGGGTMGLNPYQGEAIAGLLQHSWPLSVGHSFDVVHSFAHEVEQNPLQQSSPRVVSHSLDCPHAFGHVLPWFWQRPLRFGASTMFLSRLFTDVQHV